MKIKILLVLLLAACGAPVDDLQQEIAAPPPCFTCTAPGAFACAIKVATTRYFEIGYPMNFRRAVTVGIVDGSLTSYDTYYEDGPWRTYGGYAHPFTYYSASTCGLFDKLCFTVDIPNVQGQRSFYLPSLLRVADQMGALVVPTHEVRGSFRCVPRSWW